MSSRVRRSLVLAGLGVVLLVAAPVGVAAQSGGDYTITQSVIAGGGGTSAGEGYTLSGTVGQHDAGTLRGDTYVLEGGYWGGVGASTTVFLPLVLR